MNDPKQEDIIAVLKAIDEGWAVVDENDEDDFIVFVNESRDVMERFYPKKELIKEMERLKLIKDPERYSRPFERGVWAIRSKEPNGEWVTILKPNPLVYFYKITAKGRRLLNNSSAPHH